MNEYLTKPISQPRLVEALGRWLPQPVPVQPSKEEIEGSGGLNDAVLKDLSREIGQENLERVIETFQAEARNRWHALESATTPEGQKREAHSLVSSCSSFGLEKIGEALTGIEERARGGQMEPPELLKKLGNRLDISLQTLAKWRSCG
jgi:HPt (histidine-containing phosphotransfer) domain-containing protein